MSFVFDQVEISIQDKNFEDKTLYTWNLIIRDEHEESGEFYYASRLEALKKAQKRLYAWIKSNENGD